MSQRKALIGESNYAEFEILNDFLSDRGFEIHWVKNGHDAVDQYEQVKPDLMILDALLPGLAGLKVVQRIHQAHPDPQVKTILLSTVYKQFKDKYDDRKAVGVDAYAEKPVEIGALEKLIRELILPDDEPDAEENSDAQAPLSKKQAGPTGNFETTPFPKILHFLKKYKRTGALEVEYEKTNKVVYVQSGNLAFVSSNQSSDSLGRHMVQAGVLSVADYNASLERMLETGQQQGRILLDMGLVTPHTIFESLQGHLQEKILAIFAWEKGKFAFRSGRLKLDNTFSVEIDLMDMIKKGIQRFYPLSRLESFFNDYKNKRVLRTPNTDEDSESVVLLPSEASFLNQVDNKMTLGRLVMQTKLSLTETFQLLYFLVLIDEVRFEGDSALGDRSVTEQEEFLADRQSRRKELREDAQDSEMSEAARLERYRKMVSDLFDQIGRIDYLEMLNLPFEFGVTEVKVAYHRMVHIYHPSELYSQSDDVTKAKADGVFRALTEAYEILTDADRKAKYILQVKQTRPDTSDDEDEEEIVPEPQSEILNRPLDEAAQPKSGAAVDFDELPDFDEEFGFAQAPEETAAEAEAEAEVKTEAEVKAESSVDTGDVIDPGISWDIQEDFAESDGDDMEIDFSFDSPDDDQSQEELQVEQAGQVTLDMAAIVKSELKFQQGEDALYSNNFEEASSHFTKAIQMNPNEAEYHAYLGWTTFKSAPDSETELKEALALIDTALGINPNLDSAYCFLGKIHIHLNNPDVARANLEKAIQFNPQNEDAQETLEKLES